MASVIVSAQRQVPVRTNTPSDLASHIEIIGVLKAVDKCLHSTAIILVCLSQMTVSPHVNTQEDITEARESKENSPPGSRTGAVMLAVARGKVR